MPLNLIIPVSIGIIIIILIISSYRSLLIFCSKCLHGKFSEKYIETFRNYTGQNPYRPCIKGDLVNSIAGFYGKPEKIQTIKTDKPISFGAYEFGQNISNLFKLKGEPDFVNANSLKIFDLKVFGYNDELFNFENKTYFYFADDIFFMGEYSVDLTDDKKIEEISQILQQKYIGSIKSSSHNYIIEGLNKVLIYFNSTGFRLSIQYLNQADPKIKVQIDNYWHSMIRTKSIIDEDIKAELTQKL